MCKFQINHFKVKQGSHSPAFFLHNNLLKMGYIYPKVSNRKKPTGIVDNEQTSKMFQKPGLVQLQFFRHVVGVLSNLSSYKFGSIGVGVDAGHLQRGYSSFKMRKMAVV